MCYGDTFPSHTCVNVEIANLLIRAALGVRGEKGRRAVLG